MVKPATFKTALLTLVLLLLGVAVGQTPAKEDQLPPPVATKIPKADTTLGDVRIDNYFWLRDKNDPDVINYLEEENDYTDSIMKPTVPVQDSLFKEFLSRIKETDLSVPEKIDDYYYYYRTEQGKQYRVECRKKGSLDAPEEVILDQNELAKVHGYFDLGGFQVSPDQQLLAYAVDTNGSEIYSVYFKDLRTGQPLPDTISNTGASIVWANDNKTIFYDILDETLRPYEIKRHTLGDNPKTDAIAFEEPDKSYFIDIEKSKSKAYIFIGAGSKTTTEYRYLDANTPLAEFKVIAPRQHGIEYGVTHHDNRFFILTNENATNFKLMEAPVADPSRKNWKELMPYRPDVMLSSCEAFRDYLVLLERKDGSQQIEIRNFKDNTSYYVDWTEPVYSYSVSRNPEYNTDLLRFTYTSLVTQRSVYDYNMTTKARTLLKQDEVLGGYDPTLYQSQKLFATASDGVKIPISLVYKKALLKKDGSNPMYLYGYGSYGDPMDPWFSSARLSLLDRGFVFAIPHIRGGGEMGRQWYDNGKMLTKKNTFTDFIACAEYLIAEKYTGKDRLVISGGSAGGLLVGAVAMMRPDLMKVVIADVPFVDVLNTMLDPTIPLTVTEYEEWGNPHEKPYYDYIKSYAPYENVTKRDYPNILITGSLNDPRVAYWEPAKWCAKLRSNKTDQNLLLMKINMDAGHGGSSGRYERLKELALEYAFIFKVLGISS